MYVFRNNDIVAEDDDSEGDLNSRIPASAGGYLVLSAAGEYIIEATTFDEEDSGAITLKLDAAPGTAIRNDAAALASPAPNTRLGGNCATFRWNAAANALDYWIESGRTAGGTEFFNASFGRGTTSREICGLPTNGTTIYLRLWTLLPLAQPISTRAECRRQRCGGISPPRAKCRYASVHRHQMASL